MHKHEASWSNYEGIRAIKEQAYTLKPLSMLAYGHPRTSFKTFVLPLLSSCLLSFFRCGNPIHFLITLPFNQFAVIVAKLSKVGLLVMVLSIAVLAGCSSSKAASKRAPAGGSKCNCEKMKHLKKQNSFLYRR